MYKQSRDFLFVLVGSASVLSFIYIVMTLTLDESWIDKNAMIIVINAIYWFFIPPLLWAFRFRYQEQPSFHSPKVKVILDNGNLFTEPCAWMADRIAVSVFEIQDEVELFVFQAYVLNVQSNKKIQLQPIMKPLSKESVSAKFQNKENLLIKPGILHEQ